MRSTLNLLGPASDQSKQIFRGHNLMFDANAIIVVGVIAFVAAIGCMAGVLFVASRKDAA